MNMHSLLSETQTQLHMPQVASGFSQHAGEIRRLREALFELQCEPEPDVAAINGLMRRLAQVRSQFADGFETESAPAPLHS